MSRSIVLFGATGFTGKLVAAELVRRGEAGLVLAGRNRDKLEQVCTQLGAQLPIVVADANDPKQLAQLTSQASVVCSTVGPYAKYGTNLVAACVQAGISYCDLTGEVHWVREMIERFHLEAVQTGARIVHCCGFDSVPADLAAWLLHHERKQAGFKPGSQPSHLIGYYKHMRGGISGGTVDSMRGIVTAAKSDRALRKLLVNDLSLVPNRQPRYRKEHGFALDRKHGRVYAPFAMAAINTRVVHRSNALLGDLYGEAFSYDEAMSFPLSAKGIATAGAITTALAGLPIGLALGPTASLLNRALPKPGEGPSEQEQSNGRFTLVVGFPGDEHEVRFSDNKDPGYASTARMLASAAQCLAHDDLGDVSGVLTPAAAMAAPLIARLRAVGIKIDYLRRQA